MSPKVDSKEPIPPGCVALRAGTTNTIPTRFLTTIDCLKIPAQLSPAHMQPKFPIFVEILLGSWGLGRAGHRNRKRDRQSVLVTAINIRQPGNTPTSISDNQQYAIDNRHPIRNKQLPLTALPNNKPPTLTTNSQKPTATEKTQNQKKIQ
jgi:hypothetical protein